jgi:hypothetical protein
MDKQRPFKGLCNFAFVMIMIGSVSKALLLFGN